jgi:hypothetical protein
VHIYQYATLQEIAEAIQQKLLDPNAIKEYQAWICREEHFDHHGHRQDLEKWEQGFVSNYKAREHDGLCLPPRLFFED